jgi:hypothetical protein
VRLEMVTHVRQNIFDGSIVAAGGEHLRAEPQGCVVQHPLLQGLDLCMVIFGTCLGACRKTL